MKKSLLALVCCLTAAAAWGGKNIDIPIYWQLTPEAQKFISGLKAPAYTPRTGRTTFICQGQFKYFLDYEYLHRWYDRPLRQDSSLIKYSDPKNYFINPKSWLITASDIRLTGLDGMSAIMTSAQRERMYKQVTLPGGRIKIAPALIIGSKYNRKKVLQIAEDAIKSPDGLEIDGRKLIIIYRGSHLPTVKKLIAELQKKYNNKFIFFGGTDIFRIQRERKTTVQDLKNVQEKIRQELRVFDGFYETGRSCFLFKRRYDGRFLKNVIIPLIHSVMAEPEFKNKYMAFQIYSGHENCYRFSYTLNSEGTGMLRKFLESVKLLKPDLVVYTEWDEENENTFMRPTVANGLATQRISRYYFSTINNKRPEPIPGDDQNVPNLILSYRRNVAAGEGLEFELVNVPDGGADAGSEAVLVLRNMAGKEVKRFAPVRFKGGECQAQVMKVPVVDLVEHLCVYPELQVKYRGKNLVFNKHFAPLHMAAVRSIDYKWVKHCLRDLPVNCVSELKVIRKLADGKVEIRGKVRSDVPLRSVEVIDYPNTVYMYSPGRQLQSDSKYAIIQLEGKKIGPVGSFSEKLTFKGVSKVIHLKGRVRTELKDRTFVRKRIRLSNWSRKEAFLIPAADIAKGTVEAEFSGVKKSLPLARIAAEKMAVALPNGALVVFSEMNMPIATADPIGKKEVEFTAIVRPRNSESALFIRTIDDKYRIHRGKAVTLLKQSKEKRTITVYDISDNKVKKVAIAANRIPFEYSYIMDPASLPIVRCTAGRDMDAVSGGYLTQLSGYGSGESGYGNLYRRAFMSVKKNAVYQAHPEAVKSGTQWALKFGKGGHLNLPIQFLPSFAGFEIEMEVMPETIAPNMVLLSMGRNAIEITSRKKGLCGMIFFDNRFFNSSGRSGSTYFQAQPLVPGKWNHIKIVYDMKNAWLEVNGQAGKKMKYSGTFLYPRYGAVGALPFNSSFHGQVRKLTIRLK